jgi:glycerol-3-phosphate dehydrogenase
MNNRIETDVVIFGAGIAGLWIYNRLVQEGYRCLLLADRIGGDQTLASQGIIHGGTKYALTGKLTGSSQAIREMPAIWRACLNGQGVLDLSSVNILSEYQYLWTTGGVVSKAAGFLAGKIMQSRVRPLATNELPSLFHDPAFKGSVYRLDEPVLDTASLIHSLYKTAESNSIALEPERIRFIDDGLLQLTKPDGEAMEIAFQRAVFAAGAGNESLLKAANQSAPQMQRRPLQMAMVKGDLPLLYAHCMGSGATPRMTITSYPMADGETAWYLGGEIAEQGVGRNTDTQIEAAQKELQEVLPWVDLTNLTWATLNVDRAEPQQPDGVRPTSYFFQAAEKYVTVWPTKLAFAPKLADQLIDQLASDGIDRSGGEIDRPANWPQPKMAQQPWEGVKHWI